MRCTDAHVPDYGFRHSLRIFQKFQNLAHCYICLSDELAVGIKHLAMISKKPDIIVYGFDNSPLSRAENICSFDQTLPEVGRMAVDAFEGLFSASHYGPVRSEWQGFQEIHHEIKVVPRSGTV